MTKDIVEMSQIDFNVLLAVRNYVESIGTATEERERLNVIDVGVQHLLYYPGRDLTATR